MRTILSYTSISPNKNASSALAELNGCLQDVQRWMSLSKLKLNPANALVSSQLDYCNSLFRGLSCFNQHKLQSIQNTLARTATNHRRYAHVAPILKQLHWLPVKYRCIFKTATLVYKYLHSGSPSHFDPFLSLSSCSYSTRGSHPDRQYLTVPPFHSSVFKSVKHFGHSFAFDAPKIWNELPMMCKVQVQLHPSERSSELCKSLSAIAPTVPPVSPWYDLAMSSD